MWPFSLSSVEIAERVERLFLEEEQGRKYRARGDWAYEEKRERACTEYHNLAREAELRAAPVRDELLRRLGPPGSTGPWAEADIAAAQEEAARLSDPWSEAGSDFAAACFFARYPRWCENVASFREAYAWWHRDPRFRATAPWFKPINRNWD